MKFRTILLGLAALFISFNAAYFSVSGLTKLFAGGGIAVILMASSLELGKLIGASYLYTEWKIINSLQKLYYTIAIIVLIAITSMGIYGYLTSAYQTTAEEISVLDKRIEIVEVKKNRYKEQLDSYNVEKSQLNETIKELSSGLANNVIQYKDKETGEIITTTSISTRRVLTQQLEDAKSQRDLITERSQVLNDSITKWDLDILTLRTETEIGGEVGPLKYLSELTNIPMNRVVNYLTLIIIFVFDPLAVMLIVSFNQAMKKDKGERDKKRAMKTLKVYGEKEDREALNIKLSSEDSKIFTKEIENPSEPNDKLKDAVQEYFKEDFMPKDLNNDGVISEEERRTAYERGGWRNASPNGTSYYLHPWFDWTKAERWVNNEDAVAYWKHNLGGTEKALEEYRKKLK